MLLFIHNLSANERQRQFLGLPTHADEAFIRPIGQACRIAPQEVRRGGLSRTQLTRKQPRKLLAKHIHDGDDEHPAEEQNSTFGVPSFMDRSFEQIRTEVLELDCDSQRQLIDEVEGGLGPFEPNDADFEEAFERLQAYDRGEMTAISAEESIAAVRKIIANAKQSSP